MDDDLKQRAAVVERLLTALTPLQSNDLYKFLLDEVQTNAKSMSRDPNTAPAFALGYRACLDDLLDAPDRIKAEAAAIAESLKSEVPLEDAEAFPGVSPQVPQAHVF